MPYWHTRVNYILLINHTQVNYPASPVLWILSMLTWLAAISYSSHAHSIYSRRCALFFHLSPSYSHCCATVITASSFFLAFFVTIKSSPREEGREKKKLPYSRRNMLSHMSTSFSCNDYPATKSDARLIQPMWLFIHSRYREIRFEKLIKLPKLMNNSSLHSFASLPATVAVAITCHTIFHQLTWLHDLCDQSNHCPFLTTAFCVML